MPVGVILNPPNLTLGTRAEIPNTGDEVGPSHGYLSGNTGLKSSCPPVPVQIQPELLTNWQNEHMGSPGGLCKLNFISPASTAPLGKVFRVL